MECPLCTGEFDDDLDVCPGCGYRVVTELREAPAEYKLGPPSAELDGFWKCFLGVLFLVGGFFFYAVATSGPSANDRLAEQQHKDRVNQYMDQGMTRSEAEYEIKYINERLRDYQNRP